MKTKSISVFKMSLKMQFLMNSIIVILVIGGIATFEMNKANEVQSKQALEHFHGYADRLSSGIATQFYERYGDVQAFAKNTVLQSGNAEAISKTLDQYVNLYGIYDVILVVDKNGKYIASNSQTAAGVKIDSAKLRALDYKESPWFKNVISGNYTEDKSKNFTQTYFEDAIVDPIATAALGSDKFGSGFSSIIYSAKGEVSGVITNRANFSWVESELNQVYSALKEQSLNSAEITVINKNGFVIAELDPSSNGGNEHIKQNFDVLLKLNLVEKDVFAAKELVNGRSGSSYSFHVRKNIMQAAGYSVVDSSKWISSIGWGVMVRDTPDELLHGINAMKKNFLIALGFSSLAVFFGVLFFAGRFSNSFLAVTEKLQEVAEATTETSQSLSEAAQSVASATSEQAAAVQESVSSMSEITSMIAQTGQNVKECTDISQKVASRTEDGSRIMERMVASMESIQQANGQLQNMANIINEVSNRTMVINDIVFKTQLLSINASIEAARAGQHGKGFSVVAEEVGNLAQMSGTAAKEIQTLIQDSQRQVSQIIETTQHRVSEGQSVSKEALTTFNEIATGIQGMSERIVGIGQATREQDLGIRQISIAMNEMDITTQRNSAVSTKTSELSGVLSEHGHQVHRVMQAMTTLVRGNVGNLFKRKSKVDIIDSLVGLDHRAPNSKGHKKLAKESDSQDSAQSLRPDQGIDQESISGSIDRLAKRRISIKTQTKDRFQDSNAVPSDLSSDDDSFNTKVS